MVCTASKAALSDYKQLYGKSEKYNNELYRTYDSILINGCNKSCEIMWADEGLMVHAGEILLTAFYTKSK